MSDWILFAEQKPPEGQYIQVCNVGQKEADVCYLWKGKLLLPVGCIVHNYSHWKPLDTPPPKPDAFEDWWQSVCNRLIHETDPRRIAEETWNAAVAAAKDGKA